MSFLPRHKDWSAVNVARLVEVRSWHHGLLSCMAMESNPPGHRPNHNGEAVPHRPCANARCAASGIILAHLTFCLLLIVASLRAQASPPPAAAPHQVVQPRGATRSQKSANTVAHGASAIQFENTLGQAKIKFKPRNSVSPQRYTSETMTGGVALFDYNNDGLLDIFFTNGAAIPSLEKSDPSYSNRLFRNNGDGTYTDVTEKAGLQGIGYSIGVAAGDYDNDGFVDLYVTGVNRNQLFHNNGDGTFTDVTGKAGVAGIDAKLGKTWSVSAGWFDYDNDGRLDLFVTNYVNWSLETEPVCKTGNIVAYCSPNSYTGQPNMLFHNNGDGTFTDVSVRSGVDKLIGKGMGVAFADYDGDGFVDVFVSNDTFENYLLHNNGNGTFTNV